MGGKIKSLFGPRFVPEADSGTVIEHESKLFQYCLQHTLCPIMDCGSREMYDGPSGGGAVQVECGNGHLFLEVVGGPDARWYYRGRKAKELR